MKQQQLAMAVEKNQQRYSIIYQKKQLRDEFIYNNAYQSLKKSVEKRQQHLKKLTKRKEEEFDMNWEKRVHLEKRLEEKKTKMIQIRNQQDAERKSLEKRIRDKSKMTENIISAMSDYQHKRVEQNSLKRKDIEQNVKKHRRVQSAYKRLLIDKQKERDERFRQF